MQELKQPAMVVVPSGQHGQGFESSAFAIESAHGISAALPVEEAWRPAVRANLEVSLRLARLVDEFPLPDETEPASVYTA